WARWGRRPVGSRWHRRSSGDRSLQRQRPANRVAARGHPGRTCGALSTARPLEQVTPAGADRQQYPQPRSASSVLVIAAVFLPPSLPQKQWGSVVSVFGCVTEIALSLSGWRGVSPGI